MVINKRTFDKMPKELKDLFEILPNESKEQVVSCFPDTKSGNKIKIGGTPRKTEGFVCTGSPDRSNALMNYGDSGNASRYFKTCPILDEDVETQRIFYTAKASKKERNEGLQGIQCVYKLKDDCPDYIVDQINKHFSEIKNGGYYGQG